MVCFCKKLLTVSLTAVFAINLYAGDALLFESDTDLRFEEDEGLAINHEFDAEYSYVFSGDIKRGNLDLGSIDEHYYSTNYVASIPVVYGTFARVGVATEAFHFGSVGSAPIPDQMETLSMIVGFDYEISDQWLIRVEAQPGIYSEFEDVSWNDVNVPVIIGGTYLVDADLQWIFGALIDPWREIPVLPAVGVRWQFADDWVLNLILPKPKLEYSINESLTAFIHGELKSGSFRVGGDLGSDSGIPRLNDEIVQYTEARVGAGLNYKITPWLSAELDGGVVPYRVWSYDDEDLEVRQDEIAPFLQVGIKGAF